MSNQSGMSNLPEEVALAPLARWLGQRLLFELTAADLDFMSHPSLRPILAESGITPPTLAELPALAARWFELFLQPTHSPPPVQSLWQEGRYEGESTAAVRRLAEAAGLQWGNGARGAPPDHLGSLLLLWAELVELAPPLAQQLVRQHFGFVREALQQATADRGFHGAVAIAVVDLVAELQGQAGH
jgi:TorA maturation chaperone TorD